MAPERRAELEEFGAFVGPRADYYLRNWVLVLDDPDRPKMGNLGAFLLSGLWLPYRKMYRTTCIFYSILILETVFEDVLFLGILGRDEVPIVLIRIIGLVAAGVCGYFGNSWYLSHSQRMIRRAKDEGFRDEELLMELRRRGGVSLAASFGLTVAFLFLLMIVVTVMAVLFDPQFLALLNGSQGGPG